MSVLLELRDIEVSFGTPTLLDGVTFQIEAGERVCIVGRNGAGKSTLLKVIGGEIIADDGHISKQNNLKIARLVQAVPNNVEGTIYDVVAEGLGATGQLLRDYHECAHNFDEDSLDKLGKLQSQIDAVDGWSSSQFIDSTLSRLSLEPDVLFSSLSGGLKRRVLLGQALVSQPDILLLDEPTNHLDVESINWLEEFLLDYRGALIFITHDRAFLRKLATRIVDVDRGKISSWPGDYENYLRRKQELLDAEEAENARFDKRMAQEEVWIRQGIKARRTRNEGRVRALKAMRAEFSERRTQQGKARITAQDSSSSGKIVTEAENISYKYPDTTRTIVRNLSTTIMRGDKIGVIGPNGAGKTTLLNLLLDKLKPDSGSVKTGTKIELAYFDQHRSVLDDTKTAAENVGEGSDNVIINGNPKHVIGYLSEFLFSPERARAPITALSGGERNRLMLAKLFTRSFNVLVMDEPTNDLDVETLELLEELLMNYEGTLLLVSHDREFVNNVVTSTLAFEGNGVIGEYVGGYDDWVQQRPAIAKTPSNNTKKVQPKKQAEKPASTEKKLSQKDQRELNSLPKKIEQLEEKIQAIHDQMADADFYQQDQATISKVQDGLAGLEQDLETVFARWEELESLQ